MRTLNVAEMTLNELANVLWNSPCPVARQTVLDEMKARRGIFLCPMMSNGVER